MLADAILVVHFMFVMFVTGGFALILAGGALHWSWVRNRIFRSLHLGAIAVVAAEAIAGIACPLTVWEDALRRSNPQGTSFVGRWVARILYYDLPEWVFALAYAVFGLAVALVWRLIPPQPTRTRHGADSASDSRDRRYHCPQDPPHAPPPGSHP